MSENGKSKTENVAPVGGYYMPAAPDEDEIDLFELWQTITNQKKLIVVIPLMCTLIATAAALVMTPIYRADVLLSPVSDEQTPEGLSALDAVEALATLSSETLLAPVKWRCMP